MTKPVRFLSQALDDEARWFQLPQQLKLQTTWPISFQLGHSRLLTYQDFLIFANGEAGLMVIGSGRPETWQRLNFQLAGFGRGFGSKPLLIENTGDIYQWSPGSVPQKIWSSPISGYSLTATALSENRILIGSKQDEKYQTRLLDIRSGKILWQNEEFYLYPFAFQETLLLSPKENHDLLAMEIETGQEKWRFSSHKTLGQIIGIVEGALWVTTSQNVIFSLDLATGKKLKEITLETRVPQGVLDPQGRWHLCSGIYYQMIDLVRGETLLEVEFDRTTHCPSPVSGQMALLISDGRLIFVDDHGEVFVLNPEDPSHPQNIWNKSHVFQIGVAHNQLVLMDHEGKLSILGDGSR